MQAKAFRLKENTCVALKELAFEKECSQAEIIAEAVALYQAQLNAAKKGKEIENNRQATLEVQAIQPEIQSFPENNMLTMRKLHDIPAVCSHCAIANGAVCLSICRMWEKTK